MVGLGTVKMSVRGHFLHWCCRQLIRSVDVPVHLVIMVTNDLVFDIFFDLVGLTHAGGTHVILDAALST